MVRPPFTFNRLVEYTPETVMAELRRVAQLVHPEPLSKAGLKLHGRVGISTVRRHFGSWRSALVEAGITHVLDSTKPVTQKMSQQMGKGMSDEEMLQLLRNVSQAAGTGTLTKADFDRFAPISASTISRRFRGWGVALERAGLDTSRVPRRFSDDECFENLLRVWTHLGRSPRLEDMARSPSTVGIRPYLSRWRTWRQAVKAFVDRVNSDTALESAQPAQSFGLGAAQRADPPSQTARPAADQRAINVGLRYQILKRDRFRCVVCGRSPAATPGLELHVDHIVPYSRGGKTAVDNLRTACRDCNLGKGHSQ